MPPHAFAFMGSKAIGCRLLMELVAGPDRPRVTCVIHPDDQADPRSALVDIRALATQHEVPFHVSHNVREDVELLRGSGASVVIVAGWYRMIPVEDLPSLRFFGFHASLLPRYRGGSPLSWQIIAGEPEVGLSFFQLESGMDSGGIVEQRSRPLDLDESIADAVEWVGEVCPEILRQQLFRLLTDKVAVIPQDHSRALYCAQRYPEDGNINWAWSARRVHDFVRAQTRPYPGAFTTLPDGRHVTIWRTFIPPEKWLGTPGAVIGTESGCPIVSCGEGAVIVADAELDGFPRGLELLRDRRIRLGRLP